MNILYSPSLLQNLCLANQIICWTAWDRKASTPFTNKNWQLERFWKQRHQFRFKKQESWRLRRDEIKLSHIHRIMHASLKRKPTFFRIFSKFWHLGVCRTPETQSLVNRNKRIKRDASKWWIKVYQQSKFISQASIKAD